MSEAFAPGQTAHRNSKRRQPLVQAGAICYRPEFNDFLLITSRRSGRWGIPKGNIDPGESSARAAEREAFEEAGVLGVCRPEILGEFSSQKDGARSSCRVLVHLLEVHSTSVEFPEKGQRAMKWITLAQATKEAQPSGLRDIFQRFALAAFLSEN